MSDIEFGVFCKTDGALIHLETGLVFAPHIKHTISPWESAESPEESDELDVQAMVNMTNLYVEYLRAMLSTGEFAVNEKAVAYDLRYMYKDDAPAEQPDTSAPAPAPKPVSNEALQAKLEVHTMALNKAAKGKNKKKKAHAVYGVKKIYSAKTGSYGIVFIGEDGEEGANAFWDNSTGDDDLWKNPVTKLPQALEADVNTASPGTVFVFDQPMIIGLSSDGKYVNFDGLCEDYSGKWTIR